MESGIIETYLGTHPLFRGVDRESLHGIADRADVKDYQSGTYLFRQHDEARRFYVILHGQVALEILRPDGEPEDLQLLSDGDVIGWSWLFAPYEWQWNGRVVEPTQTIALDAVALGILCDHDRSLGSELMTRMETVMLPWPTHSAMNSPAADHQASRYSAGGIGVSPISY